MSDGVTFGMDFSEPIKNIKKNETSLKEASKSLEKQGKVIDNIVAAQTKMARSLLSGSRGVSIMSNAAQVTMSRQTRGLGGGSGGGYGTPAQAAISQAIAQAMAGRGGGGGGGGGGSAGSTLLTGMNIAKGALVAFAAAVSVASAAMANISAANATARGTGDIKTIAARSAKVLGGKASYYQNALDKMGEAERGEAMNFLQSAITRKQTQFIGTPKDAIHGALTGIRSGDITGATATNLAENYLNPQLAKYGKGATWLTEEQKLRAQEGNIEAVNRNENYEKQKYLRLRELNTKRLRETDPWTFGAADTMTGGGAGMAWGGMGLDDVAGDPGAGLGRVPGGQYQGPTSVPGARSGEMGSARGNPSGRVEAAMNRLANAIEKQTTNQGRPPVEAGK